MVDGWSKTRPRRLHYGSLDRIPILGLTYPFVTNLSNFSCAFGRAGLPILQRVSLRSIGRARLLRYRYSAYKKCRISSFLEIQRERKRLPSFEVRPLGPVSDRAAEPRLKIIESHEQRVEH